MKKFMSNLARNIFLASLVMLFAVLSGIIGGCENNISGFDEKTVTQNGNLYLNIKDNVTGTEITADSVYKNQALLVSFITTLTNVRHWSYNWGDGTPNDTTSRIAVHKYLSAGTVTMTVSVYDSNYIFIASSAPKTFRVVDGSAYLAKPVFKKLASVNLGGGKWLVTYGVLRQAIQCTPINAPFIVFSEPGGWFPEYLNPSDSTPDGYLKHIDTVDNGVIRKFSFGGNFAANCYATIAGLLPFFSSEYFVLSENKICVLWLNGETFTINTVTPLPGTAGDVGTSPVMRVGLNPTGDTVYFYLNKFRVSGGQNAPFWVNNMQGLTNALNLPTAPVYSDWWLAKVARATVPSNYTYQLNYGDSYGALTNWAAISGSYFFNSSANLLDININYLGGGMIRIRGPKGYSYDLK